MLRTDGWEWKFVVSRPIAERFVEAIEPHVCREIHDPARPVAYTRTTYLDTEDFSYLRSGEAGSGRRLRLREYASAEHLGAPPILTGEPYLELKESAGGARTKMRFRAPAAFLHELVDRHGDVSLDREPPRELETLRAILRTDRPLPHVTTWYRRESWIGGRFRITVDAGLTFLRAVPAGERGACARPEGILDRFPGRIVEIKQYGGNPGELPEWLVGALALLPRPCEFSKFREAMLRILRERAAIGGTVS